MKKGLPPEIIKGLTLLRKRIRWIQLVRGLLKTVSVVLIGLLAIVGIDFFLAPLSSRARAGLFFAWLAAGGASTIVFTIKPLLSKISLLKLARWLEERHPEVQERISTALELSDHPEGISPELLSQLSSEAAEDIGRVDPHVEVAGSRVRQSMWSVAACLVAIMILVVVWPREMGRLLTRAVSPFTELGNAGAFRFQINPGDLEVLEGDEVQIDLSYTGDLEKPLQLVIEKNENLVAETLEPISSDGDNSTYSYYLHSAESGFKYSARVGGSESDRFEVKVYPLPRLLEPTVTLRYPPYTEWPSREISLGTVIQSLAGTEVTVKGRLDTPIDRGEVLLDSESIGEMQLDPTARGTIVTWSQVLKPGLDGAALMKVKHRLGRELDAAQFQLFAEEDPAPEVEILTPIQREFRVKPTEQVILVYSAIEQIGIDKVEIELEVNGKRVESLGGLLPERIDGANGKLWEGEVMVLLSSIVAKHREAKQLKMRLAVSDNRPAELSGPGIGYSEWLEFKLDMNAESLVRQELRNQDSDLKKTVEEAIKKVQEARNKMHDAKGQLYKEQVSERAEKVLAQAREKLEDAKEDLTELSERMKQSVQEHRRNEVGQAVAKLDEAKKSVENTPLQDTPEARISEIDNALRESEEAINDLRELRQEVQKDQPKTNDLAKLQEMAQKQAELARKAAKETPDQDWENDQRRMQEQIRQEVAQSPEAKAVAMKAQADQAMKLSSEAEELKDAQEGLSKLSDQAEPASQKMNAEQLSNALVQEQQKALTEAREEISEARRDKESDRAEDLKKAINEAQQANNEARQSKPEQASELARKAANELAKSSDQSPSQDALKQKQEKLSEAFKSLAEGDTEKAQDTLKDIQEMMNPREIAKVLAKEQREAAQGAREEIAEVNKEGESRTEAFAKAAEEGDKAANEAQKNNPEMAAEAAKNAAEQLAKAGDESGSQKSLQAKQEKLVEAFEALAEGNTAEAQAALEDLQNIADSDDFAKALAEAQRDILEGVKEELSHAQKGQEARAESLPEAVKQANEALNEAIQADAKAAAEAAQNAAGELAKGAESSLSQQSLQNQQERLAEAFEELAEGNTNEAFQALEKMQSERLTDALEQALAREQEAIVEGTKQELGEAREMQEPRANDLPEALAQAESALEEAMQGDSLAAAAAAQAAASELSKGAEASGSQKTLQERQEKIAEAFQDLAVGRAGDALASLQEMQSERAADLAQAIDDVAAIEGDPLNQASEMANQGAQNASQAAQAQQDGQAQEASQQHQQAAQKFAQTQQSLQSASQQLAQKAAQAAEQGENPNKAQAPGEAMAEALQKSAQAANSAQSGEQQQAATQAQAAAEALRQAASEAMSNMKQGGKPGDPAQANKPGEPGDQAAPPSDEAKEGVRQAQADQGVPSELAKLGINAADWEKIQATLKTDVSGSRRAVIPEDYRGLVQKYFQQVSKKK